MTTKWSQMTIKQFQITDDYQVVLDNHQMVQDDHKMIPNGSNVPGQFISECTRNTYDIFTYDKNNNLLGMLLLID